MTIYLFYEHLVREYKSLIRLKKKLEARGDRVFIYSVLFERNSFLKNGKKNPPDVIVMPWFFCESDEYILYPLICQNPNVRVISLHHEELTYPGNEHYFMSKTEYTKLGSFHFVWGNYFKQLLVNDGVPEEKIYITGNIRTDLIRKNNISREQLAEKYGLDPRKKWILFAETFGYYIQRTSESEIQALLDRDMTLEEIESERNEEIEGIEATIRDFNSVDKEFCNDYELIYRPHPGSYASEGIANWVKVISDRPIADWIKNVDFFISRRSTSVFEADAAGIPCVTYENPKTPPNKMVPGLNKYPTIESINEITTKLIDRLKERKETYYQDYIGVADGHVTERIVHAIDSVVNSSDEEETKRYFSKLHKPSFRFSIKNFLYDLLVRIMVKTGLIEKWKYPNSAYVMLKDIPYYKNNAIRNKNI